MPVTGKYQGRHRGAAHRDRGARARRVLGFTMAATLACAALLTAWPTPGYN